VAKKLFDEVAPRFESRNGGYTRLIKTRSRVGDGAPMVLVERALFFLTSSVD